MHGFCCQVHQVRCYKRKCSINTGRGRQPSMNSIHDKRNSQPDNNSITVTSTKLTAACCTQRNLSVRLPVPKRNTIKLRCVIHRAFRLPITDVTLFGVHSLNTDEAAASGGEIMPPSKKPSDNVKPGIMALDTHATIDEVRITGQMPA